MKKVISNEDFDKAYADPDNLRIIRAACEKFSKRLPWDILQNCGARALWRTLQSHDDSYKTKFSTSLYQFVIWECKTSIQTERKLTHPNLLWYDPLEIDCGYEEVIMNEYIDKLSYDEKDILYKRFYEDKTLEEIGDLKGYSKQAAHRNIQKTLSKLRVMMTK
jgi:DNA-directed RNA polymerase specialized sigma subunit